MRKMRNVRTLLAWVLAVAMVLGSAGAWAEEENDPQQTGTDPACTVPIEVQNDVVIQPNPNPVPDKLNTETNTLTGDLYVQGGEDSSLLVSNSSFTVDGSVTLKDREGFIYQYAIYSTTSIVEDTNIKVTGDVNAVSTSGNRDATALREEWEAECSVTDIKIGGDVNAESTGKSATAIGVDSVCYEAEKINEISTVTTEITGDINAEALSTDQKAAAYGYKAEKQNGKVEFSANNIQAAATLMADNNTSATAKAVSADALGETTNITVKGNATATAAITKSTDNGIAEAEAVHAESENGGSMIVTVEGKAAAEASGGNSADLTENAVYAASTGAGSQTTVTVKGKNLQEGEAAAQGSVVADSKDSGEVSVTVTGDVKADGKGVNATAESGGKTTVTVTGKVTAGGEAGVRASGGSTVTADSITGSSAGVIAEDEGTLVKTNAVNGDVEAITKAVVIVNGDITGEIVGAYACYGGSVTAKNITGSTGVQAEGNGSVVTANGTVTGTGRYGVQAGYGATVNAGDIIAAGIGVETVASRDDVNNGSVNVTADSVKAGGDGIYINNSDGMINVSVDSDVGANGNGIVFSRAGTNDMFVAGTVSGKQAAVNLDDATSVENTTLTAWKLETGENGTLIKGNNTETVNTFAASINYIVKLADGLDKNQVSTAKKNAVYYNKEGQSVIYGKTDEEYTWHTANEDEEVTLTLAEEDLVEADTVEVLYNAGDSSSKMTKGTTAGGNIFTQVGNIITLLMARGGGMNLSASVTRHTHDYSVFVKHVKEPTCSETGLDEYKCAYCSATTQKTVAENPDKHAGDTEIRNAAEATCSREGYTGDTHCKGCGAKLESGEKITKKAHTEVTDAAVAATCITTGLKEGKHCSVCKEVLVAQETVPVKGHTAAAPVKENEKAAKVGVAGSYDNVAYCKDCGAEISRETVTVPALPEPDPEPHTEPVPQPDFEPVPADQAVPDKKNATDDTSLIETITEATDEKGDPVEAMLGQLGDKEAMTAEMKADFRKLQEGLNSAAEKSDDDIPDTIRANYGEDQPLTAGGPFRAVASSYPAVITIELKDPDTFAGIMIYVNGKWVGLDTNVNDDGTVTFTLDCPCVLSIVTLVVEAA